MTMTPQAGTSQALRELTAPARNNYFYGKMLSVFHFQMEQAYFNRKRWLLNRLALGAGVLCGLEVVVAEDGRRIWVKPGVAVDPLGREIIVPSAYCIEQPRQPTDECGRPQGDPIAGEGAVTLLLCYHECESDPVPVMVNDCDTRRDCAPSTIHERFSLRIVSGLPAARPAGLSDEQCTAIFPQAPGEDFDRRVAACEALSGECAVPAEECLVLATVTLPADPAAPLVVDECGYRVNVYSNSRLFDLLCCLSDRVDACCGTQQRLLRYVSGDAQQAAPGAQLTDPLVVQVVDAAGNPVANETVTFTVRGGGGTPAPVSAPSGADGRAETRWTLGPNPGLNTMAASIVGAAELPLFALAARAEQPPPTATPPVVMAIWPDSALRLSPADPVPFREWLQRPLVAITFDRQMRSELLQDPAAVARWLRVFRLRDRDNQILTTPLQIRFAGAVDTFHDRTGFTAVYELGLDNREEPSRYLVQMRAESGNITDTGTPPLTLDAEFAGTSIAAATLTRIWNMTAEGPMPRAVWNGLVDTGARLPRSGDGAEGGIFHGWFEIAQGQ